MTPQELILADAGYCSIAGMEYVWRNGADVLVRVNPQSFVAYSPVGGRISVLSRLRDLSTVGQFGEWRVVLHGRVSAFAGRLCAVRKSDCRNSTRSSPLATQSEQEANDRGAVRSTSWPCGGGVHLYWMWGQGLDYGQFEKVGSHAGEPGHRHGA